MNSKDLERGGRDILYGSLSIHRRETGENNENQLGNR